MRTEVLVDTDVWSAVYAANRRIHPQATAWIALLLGRTVVISVQTRAEVTGGVLAAHLGPGRADRTLDQLRSTPTIPVDAAIADTAARLFAACKAIGHALQHKQHTADRWIAATAIHLGVPLLSGDGIYRNAPGLRLLDEENE